jgi:hypothetical protein
MSTRLNRLLPAAAVVAALAGWLSPLAAQSLSPDLAYRAPSWWITAVVQGKQSSLQTGVVENDRRLNVWITGFGYGLGDRCGLQGADTRSLESTMKQEVAATNGAIGLAARYGIEDGQRFAEINGCNSEDAVAARRNIASLVTAKVPPRGTSEQIAQAGRRQPDRTQPDQTHAGRSQPDEPQADRGRDRPGAVVGSTTVRNQSASRILIVRISETWDNDWGVDRLGDDVLESGASYRIPLPNARTCLFDLQVTYVGRRVEERRNVDLCANREIAFDGTGAR